MENVTDQAIENPSLVVSYDTEQPKKKRGRKPLENKELYKIITFRVLKERETEIRSKVKEIIQTLS